MFINFEYEKHTHGLYDCYVRGVVESISKEPKYKVYEYDIHAWNNVLDNFDEEKTMANIEKEIGYSMPIECFMEVE